MTAKFSKIGTWLTLTFVALCILAIVLLLWWFLSPQPTVNGALASLTASPGQQFKASLAIANSTATRELLGEEASVTLNLAGSYQDESEGQDSVITTLQVLTETESVSISVEGEARLINDQAYLLITKAPAVFPSLAAIKGQWIELPRGGGELADDLTGDENLFSSYKRLGSADLNGQAVKTYQVTATPEAVLKFMNKLARVLGTSLTSDQINQFRQGVADVKDLPVNLAISPWSRQLHRINTIISLPTSNEIDFELYLAPLESDLVFTAPENYASFQDLAAQASPEPSAVFQEPQIDNTNTP